LIRHNRYVLSWRAAENIRSRRENGGNPVNKMPSLIRFLFLLGLLGGAVFVATAALVAFVEPQPREITQPINPELLNK
jgi:hypothetical protein